MKTFTVLAFVGCLGIASTALFDGGPCIRSDGLAGTCSSQCEASCTTSAPEDICGYRGLDTSSVINCCLKQAVNSRFKFNDKTYANLDGICNHYYRNRTLSCLNSNGVAKPAGEYNPYAHLAAIGWSNLNGVTWKCTGALISDRHVIVSAHCLALQLNSPDTVRVGAKELNNFPNNADYAIQRVIYHPEFDPSQAYNDLAVLEVAKKNPNNPSNNVPACVWTREDLKTRVAAGHVYSDNAISTENSNIIDNFACRASYEEGDFLANGITIGELCSVATEADPTCDNYPVKPLVVDNVQIPFVVGVSSYRKDCEVGTPTVYTRLYAHLDWIEEILGQ